MVSLPTQFCEDHHDYVSHYIIINARKVILAIGTLVKQMAYKV